jgi:CRP-like cAMP-binding protein
VVALAAPRSGGITRLFDAEPELIAHLDAATARIARQQGVVDLIEAPVGRYQPGALSPQADEFAHLILSGLMLRRTELFGRDGVELLGAGDVLPCMVGADGSSGSLLVETSMTVVEEMLIAVLDREFERAASRWPGVLPKVMARVEDRLVALSMRLAIAKFPRLEDRLLCVLWQLADRWGRRVPGGVQLPLRLSHDVLADLCSARRPSVSGALKRMSQQGSVTRDGRRWFLHGDPPQELRALATEIVIPV